MVARVITAVGLASCAFYCIGLQIIVVRAILANANFDESDRWHTIDARYASRLATRTKRKSKMCAQLCTPFQHTVHDRM